MICKNYVSKILNTMFGLSGNISRPEFVYMGLCTTEPNDVNGQVIDEPTATSYERKLVGGEGLGVQYFGTRTTEADGKVNIKSNAELGVIENTAEIQFKTAREAWTTNGTKLYYWFLSTYAKKPSSIANGGCDAMVWGVIKDINKQDGIEVPQDTVPTFYEEQLKASIDVPLDEN